MKKIYFAPKTEIVNIQLQQMIALSAELGGRSINSSEDFGSRRGSVWDDEDSWEEDY